MAPRSLLIDGLKVLASQLIVLHHIVLYAPMAQVLAPGWPATAGFLGGEARYVVQLFLVIGGYLAAQGLARPQAPLPRLLWARWLRLVPMLAVALLAVLAATALLPRTGGQPPWQGPLPWAVAALALASLAWFNRDSALDMWGLYFFNAYGLGVLAAWAGRSRALAGLFALLCALHLADALLAARPRAGLAALTAVALALWAGRGALRGPLQRWLAYWSDASYGVFLIHYAVIVAATALWLRLPSGGPAAAWALLFGCWAASLAAGAALQRFVGRPLSGIGGAGPTRVRAR